MITAVPEIVAPAAGELMETVGSVVSRRVVTVISPLEAVFPLASVEAI